VEYIRRAGVTIETGREVGSIQELLDAGFDAVYVAIGAQESAELSITGEHREGVEDTLAFLRQANSGRLAEVDGRVVVIGGGNAAIDAARTALRTGADVTVVYRRERKDMPAIEEETVAAQEEGVKFLFWSAPHRIIGDADGNVKAIEVVKTRPGEYDKSGRRKPMPTDEIQRFDCDTVVLGVGETFDQDFCRASGLALKEGGTIIVDRFSLETSRANFYAGGDVITGASNVSNAMDYGKRAARNIDERLMGESRWERIFPDFSYRQQVPDEPSNSRRHASRALAPKQRARSSDEVVIGMDPEQAWEEAGRCLRCDIRSAAGVS